MPTLRLFLDSLSCGFFTFFLSVALACPAFATTADDLCDAAADPCEVSAHIVVDPDSVLDFGPRVFRLLDGGSLVWADNLTINAGRCDVYPRTAVTEDKSSTATGFLTLNCDDLSIGGKISTVGGGILAAGAGSYALARRGRIKAKGKRVGAITIDMGGNITIGGKISARSKNGPVSGPFRIVSTDGDVTLAKRSRIKLRGTTADPSSDSFSVVSRVRNVFIEGKIDARAKSGAYSFNFEADSAVLLLRPGKIRARAADKGARIAFNSQSYFMALDGKIDARATNITNSADGPRLHACAADLILVGDKINVSDDASFASLILGAGDQVGLDDRATLSANAEGNIEICGNSSGVFIDPSATISPQPQAIGSNQCASPNSGVIFDLACTQ